MNNTTIAFLSLLLTTLLFVSGCLFMPQPAEHHAPPDKQGNEYNPQDTRTLIKKGALLIDVRTPEEFARGHLEGAINLPHTQTKERIVSIEKDRSRQIVLYCRTGRRAEVAREDLLEVGYVQVTNGGGLSDLKEDH